MSREIIDKRFFLEVLDYPDSDSTNKINGFSPQSSSTSVVLQIEFLMQEFELVVAEDYKFQY